MARTKLSKVGRTYYADGREIVPSVYKRIGTEEKIARRCTDALLRAGYLLGVNDGEETTIERSSDANAIFHAMFTTDEDYILVYRKGEQEHFGWVRFIYGNDGWDVISDYSTNLEPVMHGVLEYAEAQEAA
ncbi:MAG: hypothetical protein JO051_03265 [Acidobacteriaceae bacterium]|nr:hypothetical protein [Acidobacteriaceae bacterium]